MKNILIILISCFSVACTNKPTVAKTATVDSLQYFFERADNDTLVYKERMAANKKAIFILSKQKKDSLFRVNYFKIANNYFNVNNLEEYKTATAYILTIATQAKDTNALAKGYSYMGDYFLNKSISDSAYYYYTQSEKLYKFLKKDAKIANAILNKSKLQFNEKDYINSEKLCFEALKYLRKTDKNDLVYQAYNVLGITYHELKEFDRALEYHEKALAIAEKTVIKSTVQTKAVSLNNIGIVFQEQKEDRKAIPYFNKGLEEANLFVETPLVYRALIENLAYAKFKIKDFKGLPDMFFESLKICDSLNYTQGKVGSNIHLSEYYAYKKDTVKAYNFAVAAYKVSKETAIPINILNSLKQLSAVNPKNSSKYSSEYIRINDSMQLEERKIRNKIARVEFETEEITLEKDRLVEQRKTIIYLSLGIILAGALLYIIRMQRAKNRELRLVQEQQKANEEIYQLLLNEQSKIESVRQLEKKRIAQELHDGVLGKLFGTRMNLGLLNTLEGPKAVQDRTSFIDELKILEQELREISHDLSIEKAAEFNNFVVLVYDFVATQKTVCKAQIELAIDPAIDWNRIENTTKINLYRILQESFQNINKYANASLVTVHFEKAEDQLVLKIKDNGSGFLYNQKKKGIGLMNMEARIKNSHGSLHVDTEIGKGTLLQFELPFNSVPA